MKTMLIGMITMISSMAYASDSAQRLEEFQGDVLVPRLNTTLLMNADSAENHKLRDFLMTPPMNSEQLVGKKVAIMSTDGVEEIEILGPIRFLKERGAQVDVVSPRHSPLPAKYGVQYPKQRESHILTVRFMEIGTWVKIDRFLDQVNAAEYDALIIPGGAWNPDSLRNIPEALKLVQEFNRTGKPTAAICHAPLVFVNAGIIQARKITGYWNIHMDLENAGGRVQDEAVVVDGNLITSRFPYDLPQFMNAIVEQLN
jgi:protease I